MPDKKPLKLSSQLEDYLETIAHLQDEALVARSKDIAERLGVSRATVTAALRSLADKGLVRYQPYSHITLTDQGVAIAREIIRRHETLNEFFRDVLQMSPEHASSNACRVEHAMDSQAMDRLVCFLAFLKSCPRTSRDWLEAFKKSCLEGDDERPCKECVGRCLADVFGSPPRSVSDA